MDRVLVLASISSLLLSSTLGIPLDLDAGVAGLGLGLDTTGSGTEMNMNMNMGMDMDALSPELGPVSPLPEIETPSTVIVWTAGFFALTATMISMASIWMQLKNYCKPLLQRYVVRILWMVPIFALSSWISLVSLDAAFYIDAFRDIYEAFVIYCFFTLLVYYLGGERSLIVSLHGRPYTKHMFPVSLWSKDVDVGDPYTFLFIKRGILQYVYVKPILAVITMYLKAQNLYNDGSISWQSGYFWVSAIYNISVCLSLYCLGMFLVATREDLDEFRPIPKFLCVKAVIFFSFWQGVAISFLVAAGVLRYTSGEMAVAIQDFLICFEMVFAAIGHWYAFSHEDYLEPNIQSARVPIYYAIRDARGMQDIFQDSLETLRGTRFNYRTFEPSEGIATQGRSRNSRVKAGLRYSDGGACKYWVQDAVCVDCDDSQDSSVCSQTCQPSDPPSHSKNSSTSSSNVSSPPTSRSRQQQQLQHQQQAAVAIGGVFEKMAAMKVVSRAPSLFFADISDDEQEHCSALPAGEGRPDTELSDEALYQASKLLKFGDYNFPAIDVSFSDSINQPDPRQSRGPRGPVGLGGPEDTFSPTSTTPAMTSLRSTSDHFHWAFWKGQDDSSTPPVSRSSTTPIAPTAIPTTIAAATFLQSDRKTTVAINVPRAGCVDNVNGFVPQPKSSRRVSPQHSPRSSQATPSQFQPIIQG